MYLEKAQLVFIQILNFNLRRQTCFFCYSLLRLLRCYRRRRSPRPVPYGSLEFPDSFPQQLRGFLVLGLARQMDVLVLVQYLDDIFSNLARYFLFQFILPGPNLTAVCRSRPWPSGS